MTTGKTIALTRQTFVGKVMSQLFNMLVGHNFSPKEQVSFNFMAAVTICSDFGVTLQKVSRFSLDTLSIFFFFTNVHEIFKILTFSK